MVDMSTEGLETLADAFEHLRHEHALCWEEVDSPALSDMHKSAMVIAGSAADCLRSLARLHAVMESIINDG